MVWVIRKLENWFMTVKNVGEDISLILTKRLNCYCLICESFGGVWYDEKGNTIYGKYNKTSATKVSKVSKVSTNQNLNPKTGDSSMIGYVGLGLSSALGLFRRRK